MAIKLTEQIEVELHITTFTGGGVGGFSESGYKATSASIELN